MPRSRTAGLLRPGVWGTSLAAAFGVGGLLAVGVLLARRLQPRPGLRLPEPAELWLLGVFTVGMLAVLLGVSVVLGAWTGMARLRERLGRAEDGGGEPPEAAGGSARDDPGPGSGEGPETGEVDPGWWTTALGIWLLGIYFAAWWALGSPR